MHDRLHFNDPDPSDERAGDRLRFVGQPTFATANSYSGYDVPGVAATTGSGSHTAFIIWVVLLGIVLPAAILGGLQINGYKFLFRGR